MRTPTSQTSSAIRSPRASGHTAKHDPTHDPAVGSFELRLLVGRHLEVGSKRLDNTSRHLFGVRGRPVLDAHPRAANGASAGRPRIGAVRRGLREGRHGVPRGVLPCLSVEEADRGVWDEEGPQEVKTPDRSPSSTPGASKAPAAPGYSARVTGPTSGLRPPTRSSSDPVPAASNDALVVAPRPGQHNATRLGYDSGPQAHDWSHEHF